MLVSESQKLFKENKSLLICNAIDSEITESISTRLLAIQSAGGMEQCTQCDGSEWIYNDSSLTELHQMITPQLSLLTGITLMKTFACARYYRQGSELKMHKDRDAGEYSLTICLDSSETAEWPLFTSRSASQEASNKVDLAIGDGFLFRGSEFYHWRNPLEYSWHLQAFFFFVDANGQYAEHAEDHISQYQNIEN